MEARSYSVGVWDKPPRASPGAVPFVRLFLLGCRAVVRVHELESGRVGCLFWGQDRFPILGESVFPIKTGRRTTVFEPCEKPTPVIVCCCDSETNVPQILHFLAQIGTHPLGSCSAHVRAAFDGSHETTAHAAANAKVRIVAASRASGPPAPAPNVLVRPTCKVFRVTRGRCRR